MKSASNQDPESTGGGLARFHTTRWSVVRAAGGDADARRSSVARDALATLCESTWYPIYAFVRRRGHSPEDARDLTQGFFARLIEKRDFAGADPDRGRFRAYLLGAVKNYLANQAASERTLRRGGDRSQFSLDLESAEGRFREEPSGDPSPEALFDAAWARELLDRTLAALRDTYERTGASAVFAALEPLLAGPDPDRPQAQVAEELGMEPGAVKVALHRMRGRYRELLRAEIRETLEDPSQVDAELAALFDALG